MKQDNCSCSVTVSPELVEAGGDMTFALRVSARGQIQGGASVLLSGADGAELARRDLWAEEDELVCDDIELVAPREVGDHVYRAVVLAAGDPRMVLAAADIPVAVSPRALEVMVWDVPSAVETGAGFAFKVGARCSCACDLGGRRVTIALGDGSGQVSATLAREPWPGTEALYFAEVELVAPQLAGEYDWLVATDGAGLEPAHAIGSTTARAKVVEAADCVVSMEVVEADGGNPIVGARVVMHPYRAATDGEGGARLRVRKGTYDVLIAAKTYSPHSMAIEVAGDLATRVELLPEPPLANMDEG